MSPERAEDMAQLNLGVEFLRLGAWDDFSSVRPPLLGKRSSFYPLRMLNLSAHTHSLAKRRKYVARRVLVFLHVSLELNS